MKNNRKKWILSGVALALVLAIGGTVWYRIGHSSSDPVYVYDFNMIGMTEYWGDSRSSYGPVRTDRIQTVMLSSTQTVTGIAVEPGTPVKKGDLLMTFDTTLSDLALEKKRLALEKLKLELEDEETRLREIREMRPMQESGGEDPIVTPDPDYGIVHTESLIYNAGIYDGSSAERPMICWMVDGSSLRIEEIVRESFAKRGITPVIVDRKPEPLPTAPPEIIFPEATMEPSSGSADSSVEDWMFPEIKTEPPELPEEDLPEPEPEEEESSFELDLLSYTDGNYRVFFLADGDEEADGDTNPISVYVVFKQTFGDMSLSPSLTWQGIRITATDSVWERAEDKVYLYADFALSAFDASGVLDYTYTAPETENTEVELPDIGSGMTAAQIAELRRQQEKKIKDTQFKIKMAESDYKIMQTEISDGNVYAQFNGQVVSVLTEQEAKDQNQPVIKVSGGGGFYVEGSISELEKDQLVIGQDVTVSDFRTGMTYTGTVRTVGDYPTGENSFSGMNNPNASYYPFTAFVDGSADLTEGGYVEIQYALGENQNGIYLENPFVRSENGKSFVYVRGANGRLERRDVETGKSLWGSYTEIRSGLTAEDKLAFPYGKNVKPGVAVQQGDYSTLYG